MKKTHYVVAIVATCFYGWMMVETIFQFQKKQIVEKGECIVQYPRKCTILLTCSSKENEPPSEAEFLVETSNSRCTTEEAIKKIRVFAKNLLEDPTGWPGITRFYRITSQEKIMEEEGCPADTLPPEETQPARRGDSI